MHVLIIPSEHFLTPKAPLAGIFQYHHARLLDDFGCKVGVLSAGFVKIMDSFDYPYLRYELNDGIRIYRKYSKTFMPARLSVKFFSNYLIKLYVRLYKEYIRKNGIPDVLHAHNCLYAGAAALEIKRQYGVPYVVTEHSSLYERNLIPKEQLNVCKSVLEQTDRITVVSTGLKKSLNRYFGKLVENAVPIYNVLEKEFIEGSINYQPIIENNEKVVFLSIGSLDSNKNHTCLLEAFSTKFKGNQRFELIIGGSGPLRKELEEKSISLGISSQVLFLGHLKRKEVIDQIIKCDVFVLPSIVETFGVVLIEALALGKPIISTLSGGPEDIVNEGNGILVSPNDSDALANAIENISKNLQKFDKRNIREDCISRFGRDVFFERLMRIYKNIEGI
ncbi:MAG: glycosyltransferase [Cyclobacteriaceae bacterium]